MKKIKAKIWVVIIISVEFLLFCSLITNAFAWSNSPTSGDFNPYNPEELATWKEQHYGTHDWIAEAALDAVLADKHAYSWKDKDGKTFWDERRKIIFLAGTEAPDFGSSPSDSGYIRTTLDGVSVGGWKTSSKHKFLFIPDENPRTADSMRMREGYYMMDLIESYTVKVVNALKEGKCDLAAFYMGCVVHLVSDVTGWHHVINKNDIFNTWSDYSAELKPSLFTIEQRLKDLHSRFERDVNYWTNDWNSREKYFYYPKVDTLGWNQVGGGLTPPDSLAFMLAFETRFECSITPAVYSQKPIPSTIQEIKTGNALWMYHNWKSRTGWTYTYKQQIQKELNRAVKFSAKALNHFGYKWNYFTDRECIDCGANKPPEKVMNISRQLMIAIGVMLALSITSSLSYGMYYFIMIFEKTVK